MKTHFALILLFLMISIEGFSQHDFTLSLEAGPNYVNRRFDNPDKIYTNDVLPQHTLSASIKAGYQLFKGLHIISGLQYFERSLTVIIEIGGNADMSYHYIELPILAKYDIGLGNFNISPVVGITNGLLFAISSKNETQGWEDVGYIWEMGEAVNKYIPSFYGGLELSYWINNLGFKIEPTFTHSLRSKWEHSMVNEYFYSYGMNFGII
ncbi:MAG: hypothetical protein ABFS38_14145, partial [Bacteroidota bacterium]